MCRNPIYSDSTVELFWEINTPFLSGGANIYRDGELLTFTRNSRSFIDDTLEENQEYIYNIALIGRSGVEGALSVPILVSTDGRAPESGIDIGGSLTHSGQPTNLSLTRYNDTTLEIFWDRSPSNPRYLVYRNGEFLAFAPGPSFFDDNVNPNTDYHYTIVVMQRSANEVIGVGFVNEPARF